MPTIHIDKVAKLYRGNTRRMAAVLNIDLEITQGEFVFFVGSRGAGKSTLLDIISGELPPDQGGVYLGGTNIYRLSRKKRAKLPYVIGRVPQDPGLMRTDTVYENLTGAKQKGWRAFRHVVDDRIVSKALSLVGMPGTEDRYPREFNYAQCRRLELAKAILYSPPILVLDGLTERLDDDTIWDMFLLLNEMNERGTTILMSTNAKKFINIMRRRIITLSDGKIVGDARRGYYGDVT